MAYVSDIDMLVLCERIQRECVGIEPSILCEMEKFRAVMNVSEYERHQTMVCWTARNR